MRDVNTCWNFERKNVIEDSYIKSMCFHASLASLNHFVSISSGVKMLVCASCIYFLECGKTFFLIDKGVFVILDDTSEYINCSNEL